MTRMMLRSVVVFLALLMLADPRAFGRQARPHQAVEKLVNVGTYRLNFKVIPGRGVTVLLEAGGGLDSTEWGTIAPRLAQETGATVVAYDRAGFGQSDLPETKYDLREEAAAMWRALHALGLDRAVVLAGFSYGGFLIRLEASQRPEAVRGMVFIDPFNVEFVDRLGVDRINNHPLLKLPFDASRPETLTKPERALARTMGAPGSNLAEKIETMRGIALPKGIPVRVITSGPDWFPEPEEQKAWREAHEHLAASIPGAKLIVAEKSDHMVPDRQPELVVSVIADVVRSVK